MRTNLRGLAERLELASTLSGLKLYTELTTIHLAIDSELCDLTKHLQAEEAYEHRGDSAYERYESEIRATQGEMVS